MARGLRVATQRRTPPSSARYESHGTRGRHHARQSAGQRPRARDAQRRRRRASTARTPMPACDAIVLTGAGKAFSGGADIREFNTPKATRRADAAHGDPHGRGERASRSSPRSAASAWAAASSWRWAATSASRAPDAPIALPEVKLGLLPGAGGTQRLPRAIGVETALQHDRDRRERAGGDAARHRALRRHRRRRRRCDGALALRAQGRRGEAAAHARARRRASTIRTPTRYFQFARNTVGARRRSTSRRRASASTPSPRPWRCRSTKGLRFERELFLELVQTPRIARAAPRVLRRARRGAHPRRARHDAGAQDRDASAVIGAGTMGGGIAMNFLNAGIPVTLLEIEARKRSTRAWRRSARNYEALGRSAAGSRTDERRAEHGAAAADARATTICATPISSSRRCSRTWTVKRDGVRDARRRREARRDPRDQHVDARRQPDRRRHRGGRRTCVGMHFFSPANVMKLLEVVRGAKTATDVLVTVMQLAKTIGKTAVVSGVCDGFIGNRMVEQYLRQAMFLLEEGASPAQVDGALESVRHGDGSVPHERPRRQRRRLAHPQAPLRREAARRAIRGSPTGCASRPLRPEDRRGLVSLRGGPARRAARSRRRRADRRLSRRRSASRRARSTTTRSSTAASSRWSTKARASSRRASRSARPTSTSSISTGYGFPRYRGGPMLYADMLGLSNVVRAMHAFAANAARRSGVLAAGAAAGAARGRRQDVQRLTHSVRLDETSIMTDAVIVSTARTGLAKSLARRIQHDARRDAGRPRRPARDRARATLDPARGRRRADRLRASRRRDRLQHRAPDRAARRLSGHACPA